MEGIDETLDRGNTNMLAEIRGIKEAAAARHGGVRVVGEVVEVEGPAINETPQQYGPGSSDIHPVDHIVAASGPDTSGRVISTGGLGTERYLPPQVFSH